MLAALGSSEAEQEELDEHILKKVPWASLPPRVKQYLGNSSEAYRDYVIKYSIEHQLRWREHLVRTVMPSEKAYFDDLVKWSRTHLMVPLSHKIHTNSIYTFYFSIYFGLTNSFPRPLQLYPYHLSDVVVKGLRLTPFKYYLHMLADVMKQGLIIISFPVIIIIIIIFLFAK